MGSQSQHPAGSAYANYRSSRAGGYHRARNPAQRLRDQKEGKTGKIKEQEFRPVTFHHKLYHGEKGIEIEQEDEK